MKQVATLSTFQMDGSAAFPYIIIVDANNPATNWGFEVQLVPGIEHRDFKRNIYHIRKVTTFGIEDQWSATIPSAKYPALAHRAVLIRGPAQDFWHQDAARYHHADEPDNPIKICEATFTAHETFQTTIKQQPERLWSHWLLVFPEGTHLVNYTLSDDATHVKMETNEMIYVHEEEDIELFGMDVHWRIAVDGGEMNRSPALKKKKSRYANRRKKQPEKAEEEFHEPRN